MTSEARPKRSDAQRAVIARSGGRGFVRIGIDAPVREIVREAGTGTGTIYRHFPTRADLVVAVFEHQVDSLVAAGDVDDCSLHEWIQQFADFLVTKHGLADAMASDRAGFERLHSEFVVRLEPVCARLLRAEVDAKRMREDVRPLELMRAVGNLCIGDRGDDSYDARRMIDVLLVGLATGSGRTRAHG